MEYRKQYLRKMCAIGFLNETNAPTTEAASFLPADLEPVSQECIEKNIVIFHDDPLSRPMMMRIGCGVRRDNTS